MLQLSPERTKGDYWASSHLLRPMVLKGTQSR